MNAQAALENHAKHYLNGDTQLAELNFEKAKTQIARTGRPDLLARAELIQCAIRSAALVWEDCPAFQSLSAQASPEDRVYADFLAGNWANLNTDSLAAQYRTLTKATSLELRTEALRSIKDPQSRLIAAATLFRQASITPSEIAIAVDTASEQGWRRPLLAWLEIQAQRAESAGDTDALHHVRLRIEMVSGKAPEAGNKP